MKPQKTKDKLIKNTQLDSNLNFQQKPIEFSSIIPPQILNNLSASNALRRILFLNESSEDTIINEFELSPEPEFPLWPDKQVLIEFNLEAIAYYKELVEYYETNYQKYSAFSNEIRSYNKVIIENNFSKDINRKYYSFNYSYFFIRMASNDFFKNKFIDISQHGENGLNSNNCNKKTSVYLPKSINDYFGEIEWKHPEEYLLNNRIIKETLNKHLEDNNNFTNNSTDLTNFIQISEELYDITKKMNSFFSDIKDDFMHKIELHKDYNNLKGVLDIYKTPMNLKVVDFMERKESMAEFELREKYLNSFNNTNHNLSKDKGKKKIANSIISKTGITNFNSNCNINFDDDQYNVSSGNLIYLKEPSSSNLDMQETQVGFLKWLTSIYQFIKDMEIGVLFNVSIFFNEFQ